MKPDDKPAFGLVMTRVIDAPRARVFKAWPETHTRGAKQGWTVTLDQLQALAESDKR